MKILKLIELMRPKQWIKNLFCFAAILFAGKLTDLNLLLINIIAFFAFCGISSCVYIVNDISDIESDRIHKKNAFVHLPPVMFRLMKRKFYFCSSSLQP